MRSERWWQETSVIEHLFNKPGAFEFIQSIRLLRHVPYQTNIKYWADEFHFESSLHLNFPESEIESLNLVDQKVELTNLLVGLTGIQGTLPYTYTNKVKQVPRKQRNEIIKFISLFNHKLTSQYVDATLSYNLPIRYEVESDNHYLNILHALSGYVGVQHQQDDLDDYFAEFSGLMQGQNNNAYALRTILNCIFKHDIKINELVVEKFKLSEEHKTKLGGESPNMLGVNSFCGEVIRQVEGKIEIVLGPLTHNQYLEFLPGKSGSNKLKRILQTWCSPTLIVDLRLVLAKSEIRPIQLSSHQQIGLAQGAFVMPSTLKDNSETCYGLIKGMEC